MSFEHDVTAIESLRGRVRDRREFTKRDGTPYVRATLVTDEGDVTDVTWWSLHEAPRENDNVIVRGKYQTWNGRTYLNAQETRLLRPWSREDRRSLHKYHRLLWFLIDCLEAESRFDTLLDPNERNYLRFERGAAPAACYSQHKSQVLRDNAAVQLCRKLLKEGENLVYLGYPVVVGARPEERRRASPLCLIECEIVETTLGLQLCRRDPENEEVNPFALELFGLDRDERDTCVDQLASSPLVAEATSPIDRMRCRIELLYERGVIPKLPDLNPRQLEALSSENRIHNTVVILQRGRLSFSRQLVHDLEGLCRISPEELIRGPLGLLLCGKRAGSARGTRVYPTVLPSNYSQDCAVSAILAQQLAAVTGPPGTGKSQTLVNAIVAAICVGRTVLFASKNNQAVDVVFERFEDFIQGVFPIRIGNRKYKARALERIRTALASEGPEVDLPETMRAWDSCAANISSLHREFSQHMQLQREQAELETNFHRLCEKLEPGSLSDDSLTRRDLRRLTRIARVGRFAARLARVCPYLPKRIARACLRRIADQLSPIHIGIAESACQEAGIASIGSCNSPVSIGRVLYQCSLLLQRIQDARRVMSELESVKARICKLTPIEELERRMADLDEHRRRTGRDRYLVSWRQMLRNASVIARSSAQRLIANIARYGEDSVWQVDLTHVFPQLLELLPVWAVTNQSARGTLPLVPGLFDVLIIDEASQSDIASIVPLLFRAKQAAFLGDPKQLTHITCLDERHIRRIADDWLLTESQRKSWNFVAANAYELACQHIDDRPVLLNQHYRSHPSIVEFCNRSFYDSQLVVCTDPGLWAGTQGIRWVNVTGQMRRTKHGSWYNREEVESVVDLVRTLLQREDDPRPSIGIVSPYRAQVELIRSVLSQQNISDSDIKVATAHRFQGDERDIMVYSSVVSGSRCKKNNLMAFQPELVNVAVSRARRRLYIVGDFSFLQASQSVLGDLARFYEELETHGALSPFELRMRNLLAEKGIRCELGEIVAGIRVAIAVQSQSLRLDVECDGHAFGIENSRMRDRDMILRQQGWRVIRFSPRTIARSPEMCVRTVLAEFERTNSEPSR